jgi:hypothetical protein
MKINKHGLPMKGLRKASGETKGLRGYYSGGYVQMSYDRVSGEIFANYHFSLGQNLWSVYPDSNIINCGNFSEPATMQEIADRIAEMVAFADMAMYCCAA